MRKKRGLYISNQTLVSVVVPVWNAAEYLREALESLRKQTYSNIEVILVNDGSSDESEAICREYCDKDFRFTLISQKNGGVSAARNLGTDESNGEWIAFMDADDVMIPNCIETLMGAQMASGAKIVVGNYSRKMPEYNPGQKYRKMAVIPSEEAVLVGLYQKSILNSPCGVLFHKSVFKDMPRLTFRRCRYEDLDLFYRAFDRVDTVCLIKNVVYYYRDNPGSFLNTWSDARLDVLDVTDRMVEYYDDRDPRLQRAAQDRRFSAHCNMLLEMTRYHVENPEQMERCRRVIKEYRKSELKDWNVRMKNKIGALISYLFIR